MNRRTFMQTVPVGIAATAAAANAWGVSPNQEASPADVPTRGAFHHSVCQWCYSSMDLADLTKKAKAMGIESIELLGEEQWKIVQANGLTCAVANGPTTIASGFNRKSCGDRETCGATLAQDQSGRHSQHDRVLRESGGAVRCRWLEELCDRAEAHHADGGGARCHHHYGVTQQQG